LRKQRLQYPGVAGLVEMPRHVLQLRKGGLRQIGQNGKRSGEILIARVVADRDNGVEDLSRFSSVSGTRLGCLSFKSHRAFVAQS